MAKDSKQELNQDRANHPCVVWGNCFLWILSLFGLTFSLVLHYCISDALIITGTNYINIVVFVTAVIMLPTTLHMLHLISMNRSIRSCSMVSCCPLWICMLTIIMLCILGCILCIKKMWNCSGLVQQQILQSMINYKNSHKHKKFIDNIQWTLKCCGLNSYRDWFTRDWHDKIQDFIWVDTKRKRYVKTWDVTDSVPFSCCKSGSCISNYLTELGTYSVHTNGCRNFLHHIIIVSMSLHVALFVIVILTEICILVFIMRNKNMNTSNIYNNQKYGKKKSKKDVVQIMDIKDNFRPSSDSYIAVQEESDEEFTRNYIYENY